MRATTEVLYEQDGAIGRITFRNADGINLMSAATMAALEAQLEAIAHHPEVRVLVLRGDKQSFMAGGDVHEMLQAPAGMGRDFSQRGQRCLNKLARFEHCVTIAAIEGAVVGGGFELALACDLRIMAKDAKVGFPEVKLGLIPAWGGTQRAFSFIGPGRIRRLLFTGHLFTGDIAAENGLVNEAVPASKVMELVEEIAQEILASGPTAVRLAKRVLCRQESSWLEPGWLGETEAFEQAFAGEEAREGLRAFLEKRPPKWANQGPQPIELVDPPSV